MEKVHSLFSGKYSRQMKNWFVCFVSKKKKIVEMKQKNLLLKAQLQFVWTHFFFFLRLLSICGLKLSVMDTNQINSWYPLWFFDTKIKIQRFSSSTNAQLSDEHLPQKWRFCWGNYFNCKMPPFSWILVWSNSKLQSISCQESLNRQISDFISVARKKNKNLMRCSNIAQLFDLLLTHPYPRSYLVVSGALFTSQMV